MNQRPRAFRRFVLSLLLFFSNIFGWSHCVILFALAVWQVATTRAWRVPMVGVVVAGLGKFLSHFVSGILFWSAYAPPQLGPVLYSAFYNASFLIPEFIISGILIYLLIKGGTVEIGL